MLDPDTCYRALTTHDARFDGRFFVGVATTGIYCRPVCTARTPRADRCTFHRTAAEAERAGFRACFRCRPELAPGCAPLDSVPRLVAAAVARIDEGFLQDRSVEALASELGVTSRHLRRAMESELGVSPLELALSRRLALAKQLLHDTRLDLSAIAFASGFGSVRRFNAAFLARFGRPPSSLRRVEPGADAAIVLRLEYRPPLDWDAMIDFLGPRAITGVEEITSERAYRRTMRVASAVGTIRATHDASHRAIRVEVSPSLASSVMTVASKMRALFDLDADPAAITTHLSRDRRLAPLVARRPGLRVPGAVDPFETVVRAILGQQISVRGAITLASRLAARFGDPIAGAGALTHVFPSPAAIAAASIDEIAAIGMPRARAASLVSLAQALHDGTLRLDRTAPMEETLRALEARPGIGPWTASYVAMRALRWPDAFLPSDLGVKHALGDGTPREITRRAEPWRPWRAYAVLHLWTALSEGTKETR